MGVQPSDIIKTAKYWTRRIAPSLRYHDREELEQYLTLQLLLASRRFNPSKGSWRSFSVKTAQGAAKDWFAKDYYRRDVLLGEDEEIDVSTTDISNQDILSFAEQFEGKKKKLVVCMALGLTDAEIARVLAISNTNVGKLKLDLLRDSLQKNSTFSG